MHDMRHAGGASRVQQPGRCGHVIGLERGAVVAADLGMADHQAGGALQRALPAILSRQIGLDDADIGVQPGQHRRVGGVLVDGGDGRPGRVA